MSDRASGGRLRFGTRLPQPRTGMRGIRLSLRHQCSAPLRQAPEARWRRKTQPSRLSFFRTITPHGTTLFISVTVLRCISIQTVLENGPRRYDFRRKVRIAVIRLVRRYFGLGIVHT